LLCLRSISRWIAFSSIRPFSFAGGDKDHS
jgi:hypothetical protein